MSQQFTLKMIVDRGNVCVKYYDDDVLIVDDLKALTAPVISRFDCNLLVLVLNGRGQAEVGGRHLEFAKNQMVILPPNATLTDIMCSPDFEFRAIFLTTRLLQSFLRDKMAIWNEVVYVRHSFIFDVEEQGIEFFGLFYEMLCKIIESEKLPDCFKSEFIHSLLRPNFFGLCVRMNSMAHDMSSIQPTATGSLFHRFLLLLNSTEKKHRSVESYAAELSVSAKYLSSLCKRNSGKTANVWITEHVMEDLHYFLCHTDHSIKEICTILGFPNPSFFGKYVKMHFGVTPAQLRKGQK